MFLQFFNTYMIDNSQVPEDPTVKDVFGAWYQRNKMFFLFFLDLALNVLIIGAMVILIRTFLFSPFQVYGPSMCDTFNYTDQHCKNDYGDYIIVNKFGYLNLFGLKVGEPVRGDVVVFRPPRNDKEFFIKRIIGLPGETVVLKDGQVFISNSQRPDGFQLDEPYLNDNNKGNTRPILDNFTTFKVPQGGYFVMGDNRAVSSDSRVCFREGLASTDCNDPKNTPFITMANIEGRAWVLLWPFSKLGFVQNPL